MSAQLELAELDESRARLAEAQVRALRAQISPHFVYNALTAIASFVRTDPARARELLLEFADFTRYSSRTHGEFTTLAEELRSIDRYLLLERARFGDRLQVALRVAPEVLPVAVPYLCLQPLVENAVKHGLEERRAAAARHGRRRGRRRGRAASASRTTARAATPSGSRGAWPGTDRRGDSMGLGNVDARLRAVYGDDHGLVVETAPGAGTKVTVRVPKFARRGARRHDASPVLAVDDEPPALDELAYLLRADPRVGEVVTAADAVTALRVLEERAGRRRLPRHPHARARRARPGPGAGPLRRSRPPVVFVTAYEDAAVDAFELRAVDYLLKPVRADRLAEAVRPRSPRAVGDAPTRRCPRRSVAVELGGVTRGSSRWPTCATSRRRATTPGCTPRDGSHLRARRRWRPGGALGAAPASCACTARTWCRAAHISELRVEPGGGARRRGVGELVSCRSAGGTPASSRTGMRAPRTAGRGHDRAEPAPARGRHRPGARARCAARRAGPALQRARRADRRRRPARALAGPRAAGARAARSRPSFAFLLGGLPLLFALAAGHPRRRACSALALPWLLLGVLVYPALLLGRLAATCGWPSATSATSSSWSSGRDRRQPRTRRRRRRRSSSSRTIGIGAYGLRLARTTERLPRRLPLGHARSGTPARSAASTCRPRPSSASPAWCWPTAPTRSGTRSASSPATSSCCCSSPRRCAARAPTRVPDFAEARLRLAGGAAAGQRARGRASAGCTSCRSCRAPGWRCARPPARRCGPGPCSSPSS